MNTRVGCFCFALLLTSLPALAQSGHHHLMPGDTVGTVSFPTSCAPAVQKQFEHGVALLHSFEYEMADNEFKAVAEHDPQCAMAYWGQAMSFYHQLWDRPSKDDLKQGADLLKKAADLKPKTAREREYIDALTVFYGDSDKLNHGRRADAYSKAMEGVYQHNPQDHEAAAFYALSLLASGGADATHANEHDAVAILNKIFAEEPDHPGIAHYIIHSCDNPQMASLGLAAARKYASIAPSSPHAVHMPSHIFARLGLWRDDISSNQAALVAADKMAAMKMDVMHHRLHSMDFLEYAYLQIGDDHNAKAQIDALAGISRDQMGNEFKGYHDEMVAIFSDRYAIERRQWKEAMQLEPAAGAPPEIQLQTLWAHAVAAGHLHDAAAARDAMAKFDHNMEELKKGPKAYFADSFKNGQDEAHAWSAYAQGRNDEALGLLRSVADRQDKVGKGESELPAREMLADMLLEMNRPKEALAEYQVSLKTDPNRFNGLYGAAQAAEMIQHKDKAQAYYAQLLKNCHGVQSDRVELTKARTLLAQK
ncbi:MAG TPA: hypothetical protein VFP59_15565 [Candidatus Angelobacter sp.]|nr:hypothetical protein [Candidatus Angelobacter sp.]